MICKFSVMAIHSFCHLEEPVPQNNDLKKALLFARKNLHVGISTDASQGCFFKSRSLTLSGMRISEQTTGDSHATDQVWVACHKSVPKLECKGSRVLMMNKNGFLEDNNGYGIFKSSGILDIFYPMVPLEPYPYLSYPFGEKVACASCEIFYFSGPNPATGFVQMDLDSLRA